MKELSLFQFKNSLGAKMRKGFKQLCNGDGSTSTLNQQRMMGQGATAASGSVYSPHLGGGDQRQPTLEEMILQLEMEEAASRRAKLDEEYGEIRHRMSCVNSSDILRSARSALNQYPRFSLDGKDAMYRSSFRNMPPVGPTGARNSRGYSNGSDPEVHKLRGMPAVVAGESVVWCSPGVVAKLMGLEAMPIPVQRFRRRRDQYVGLNASFIKRQNLRKTAGRLHHGEIVEKTRSAFDSNGCGGMKRSGESGSCSSSRPGYYIMKPVGKDLELRNEQFGWEMRHFRPNDASQY